MAKQKKEEVTLQELFQLKNSAQLVLNEVDRMIAELAAGSVDSTREIQPIIHASQAAPLWSGLHSLS